MTDRRFAGGGKDPLAPEDVVAPRAPKTLAGPGGPIDPSASRQDDDFVPQDVFDPVVPWQPGNVPATRRAPQLDTGDADFIPPDIFAPAGTTPDQNTRPALVPQPQEVLVAPASSSAP